MSDNLGDMLSSILSDEKSVEKLSGIISALGLGGNNSPEPSQEPAPQNVSVQNPLSSVMQNVGVGNLLSGISGLGGNTSSPSSSTSPKDPRHSLLLSLKPFLNDNRSKHVDKAIGALRIMEVFNSMKGKGV